MGMIFKIYARNYDSYCFSHNFDADDDICYCWSLDDACSDDLSGDAFSLCWEAEYNYFDQWN